MRLNVGTRVRFVSKNRLFGATGTVVEVDDDLATVRFDENVNGWGEDCRYWTCFSSNLVRLDAPFSCELEDFI